MIVKRRNWCKGDVNNSSCGHCTVSAMVAFFHQSKPSYCLHSFSHLSFLGNYLSLWIQVSCKKRSDGYNLFLDFFSWFFRFSLLFHCQRFMRDMLWNWGRNCSMKKENKPIKKGYFLFSFSLFNFFSHFFFIYLINGYFLLPSIGFTTSFNLINRLVLFLGMQLF